MTNFNLSTVKGQCSTFWAEAIKQKGIVKNQDGTISVYIKNSNNVVTPYDISKTCCEVLSDITKESYFYDLNAQKCRWSAQSALDCGFDKPFKVVLNPVGNDGAIFNVNEGEISSLIVDFDYLFKFNCENLLTKISPVKPINPDLSQEIKKLENQILVQTTKCEEISSRLAYTQAQFDNTKYSVVCDLVSTNNIEQTIPSIPTLITPSGITNFNPISNNPLDLANIAFNPLTNVKPPVWSPINRLPSFGFLDNNPFVRPDFVSTRTPISNIFVPQTRPDVIQNLVFERFTANTITTPVFPRVPIFQIPPAPLKPLPSKPILISPSISGNQIVPFTRTGFGTGFGGIAPLSFPTSVINPTTNNTYCITEPLGLTEWETILGADRFTRFINGDVDSYTCRDVILLSQMPNAISLLYSCDTPFGTKSTLKTKLDGIIQEQSDCQATLDALGVQLAALKIVNVTDTDICGTPISVLENLSVSVTLETVDSSTGKLTTVYEYGLFDKIGTGNLYDYLVSKRDNSGLFICGEPLTSEGWATGCTSLTYPEFSGVVIPELNNPNVNVTSCIKIKEYLKGALFTQSGLSGQTNGANVFIKSLTPNILNSNWLHSTKLIDDQNIIKLITNKKVKISIKVNSNCGDLCVLIDKIVLDKNTTKVTGSNILLTKSPGFKLTRIIDNKKSWINNDSLVNREFSITKISGGEIRQTDYDVNDERLIINTKEIDLDFNLARGIENDVWNYIVQTPNALSGVPTCVFCGPSIPKTFQDDNCFTFQDSLIYEFQDGESGNGIGCCGDDEIDLAKLLTTNISEIKTINNFETTLIAEFIDAKSRQTLSAYPTLKALYDRYLLANTNKFNYYSMEQFSNLIGNYWVDIIEQVVPATSIWGSTKIYRNTIFDAQKFKYKPYTLVPCRNTFAGYIVPSPINVIDCNDKGVEVQTSVITITKSTNKQVVKCNDIFAIQFNTNSEFIGTVKVVKN